jgi:hypothetical protein
MNTLMTRMAALPRDARDTLFLLAVIALVVLPQVENLPWWCSTITAMVLVWRGMLAVQARPLPSKWWRIALLVMTLGATYATHRTLLGRDAGVTLVVILLALKTLELRARRDAFVIFFLSFFAMLTNFFYSQSLLTALTMLLALLGLLTALVNAHMPVGRPPLMQAARTAGWMALAGAPIMLALFMLFPRLAPLWGTPGDAMAGAPACRTPCAWAPSPSWRWTKALPRASSSTTTSRRRRASCTSAARCSRSSTAANGPRCPSGRAGGKAPPTCA